jgi:hypothetical protein
MDRPRDDDTKGSRTASGKGYVLRIKNERGLVRHAGTRLAFIICKEHQAGTAQEPRRTSHSTIRTMCDPHRAGAASKHTRHCSQQAQAFVVRSPWSNRAVYKNGGSTPTAGQCLAASVYSHELGWSVIERLMRHEG